MGTEEPFLIGNIVEAKYKRCWYSARILEENIESHDATGNTFKVMFLDPDYEDYPMLIKQRDLRKIGLFSMCNPWIEAYDEKTKKYYPSELLKKSKHDGCWTIRFNIDSNDGGGNIYHDFPEMMLTNHDFLWIHKNDGKIATLKEENSEHDEKFMKFACSMVNGDDKTTLFKLTAEQDAIIVEAVNSHHALERVEERIIFQEFLRSMRSAINRLAFRQSREDGVTTHIITTTTHVILSENLKKVITVYLTKKSFSQWQEMDRAKRHLKSLGKKGSSCAKGQKEIKEAMTVLRLKMSQKNQSSPRPASLPNSSVIGNTSSQNMLSSRLSKNYSYMYTVDIICEICRECFKLTKDEQLKYMTKGWCILPMSCKKVKCMEKWKSIKQMKARQKKNEIASTKKT